MPILTINIESKGTPLTDGGTADVDHMWYSLTDNTGKTDEFGFGPFAHAVGIEHMFGPGTLAANGLDSTYYLGPSAYSKTVEITQDQYNHMLAFGNNPSGYGFDLFYDGLENSCIDFVWKALEVGGLNPIGFQGVYWPWGNTLYVPIFIDGLAVVNLFKDLVTSALDSAGSHLTEVIDTLGNLSARQTEMNSGANPNTPGSISDFLLAVLNKQGTALLDFLFTPAYGTPTNPTTFDLSTDPNSLNPTSPDSLGSSGLLAGGAAYNAAMAAADGTRPGNHSPNATADLMNALRSVTLRNTSPGDLGTLQALVGVPDAMTQTINGVTNTIQGMGYYDDTQRLVEFVPDAGQRVNINGQTVVMNGDTRLIPTSAGWVIQNSNAVGQQLLLTFDGKRLAYTDPLSLDADGDGIRMSAQPVNFDTNADGAADTVYLTAPTDPLLVLDANGDGRINHGSELVKLIDPSIQIEPAADQPLNLFNLDSNADKRLDLRDTAYTQLQLWADRNRDGYAGEDERQSLSDVGIVSIDFNPSHLLISETTPPNTGQAVILGVAATYADGSYKTLWDVPLQTGHSSAVPITSSAYGSSGAIDIITGADTFNSLQVPVTVTNNIEWKVAA